MTAEIAPAHAIKRHLGAPRLQIFVVSEADGPGLMKRVARLMLNAGLVGVSRRKSTVTTVRDGARQAPDLVDRNYTGGSTQSAVGGPNLTVYRTSSTSFSYRGMLDAFSRRIVGWSMATTLHMQVVLDVQNMALWQRRPSGVIHHSDHGSQYTSIEFGKRCQEAALTPLIGSSEILGIPMAKTHHAGMWSC